MTKEAATSFLDRLLNEPGLRSRFRSDPEGTMREAGLDEEERRALAGADWSGVSDEELTQRVSKAYKIR
jgi:hypothetical protein